MKKMVSILLLIVFSNSLSYALTDEMCMNAIRCQLDQFGSYDLNDDFDSEKAYFSLMAIPDIIPQFDVIPVDLEQIIMDAFPSTITEPNLVEAFYFILRELHDRPAVQKYLLSKLASNNVNIPRDEINTKSLIRIFKGSSIEDQALYYAQKYSYLDAIIYYTSKESLKYCESVVYDNKCSFYSRFYAAKRIKKEGNPLPLEDTVFDILENAPLTYSFHTYRAKIEAIGHAENNPKSRYVNGLYRLTDDENDNIRHSAIIGLTVYDKKGIADTKSLIRNVRENTSDQYIRDIATSYLER